MEGLSPEEQMRKMLQSGGATAEMLFGTGGGAVPPEMRGYGPGVPSQPQPGRPFEGRGGFLQRTVYMFIDKKVDPDESYSYKVRFVADLKDPDLSEKERILESMLSDATGYEKILAEIEFFVKGGTEDLIIIPIRKWRYIEGQQPLVSEKERLKAEASDVKIRSDASVEDVGDFDIPMYGGEWVDATFQVKKGEKIGRVKELHKRDPYGKVRRFEVDFFTGCTLVDVKYAIRLEKKVVKENVFDNVGRIIGQRDVEKRLTAEKLQIVYLDRKGNLKNMWEGTEERKRPLRTTRPRVPGQREQGSRRRTRRERIPGVPPEMMGPGGVPGRRR